MLSERTFEYLQILGFLYLQHKQPQKAVTVFRALLVARPEHLSVLRGLAWSLLQCGDSLGCLRLTDRYEQVAGALTPGMQILRGRALFGLGRTDEARETLVPGSEIPVVVRP